MTDAVELATAYISLVPSMKGSQGAISKELIPGAESAAVNAGKAAGTKFSGSLGKAAMGAGVGVAAGVVAGFAGLYQVGSVFDDVADTIRVGTGKSGAALDALTESAKNVGKSVPADFQQVGTTVSDVSKRMGLTGGTLEKVASQYLEAGRMLGTEVDVNKTSAAFSAFQIKGDAVSGAMDTLFQVSQSTGVGMNDLAAAVQKNAPAMQTLGFSFKDTAVLAGSLDKAGLNSTAMMAAMSKGMVTLAKKGEEPQAAFKRVTGEIGAFVKKGDTAGALNLAAKVFGTKGATQFVGAIKNGSVALGDLTAGAKLSGDTILGVGGETQDFAEKWQLVQNKAQAAMEPLASAVFTALGDALSGLMPTLESFGGWLADNTWVLGAVAAVIGVVLVAAFIAWTASIWAATIALLANPLTWIILGIVALIAGLVLLVMNWDKVAAWLSDVWAGVVAWAISVWDGLVGFFRDWINNVVTTFNAGISGLASWLGGIWSNIVNFARSAWDGLVAFFQRWIAIAVAVFNAGITGLKTWLAGIWNGIVNFARDAWNGLVNWIRSIPSRIMDGLAAVGRLYIQFGQWILSVKDAAVAKFGEIINWIKSVPEKIVSGLGDLGRLLLDAGSHIMQGLLDGITAGFKGVQDFVGGIGDWIAKNKGPKAYDLALLVPAGGWIMTGLRQGIRSGIPELQRELSGVADVVAGSLRGGTVDLRATRPGFGASAFDVATSGQRPANPVEVQFNGPVYGNPQHIVDELESRKRRALTLANLGAITVGG